MPAQIKWKEKIYIYGQFLREIPETLDKDKPWEWTRKSDLKVETEALIFAAQGQALRTNYVKFDIEKSVDSPPFVLCNQASGSGSRWRIRSSKQKVGCRGLRR